MECSTAYWRITLWSGLALVPFLDRAVAFTIVGLFLVALAWASLGWIDIIATAGPDRADRALQDPSSRWRPVSSRQWVLEKTKVRPVEEADRKTERL